MTHDYDKGVTIGIAASDVAATASKMEARHAGEHDTVILFVPKGMGRDAVKRVWRALDTAPAQDPREFERDQALAYEGNISRMFEGT